MAWTSPMTAVSGDLLTATEYNVNVRDNFLEMAAAFASDDGEIYLVDATNRLKPRKTGVATVIHEDHIRIFDFRWKNCQTFGPSVTVNTGNRAIVTISAEMKNKNNNAQASASFEVSGSTRIKPTSQLDDWRITHDGKDAQTWSRYSSSHFVSLNPGLNTFTMKYRTGNLGPVFFRRREIVVLPL